MRTLSEINQLLAAIEGELQTLDAHRAELLAQVASLKQERAAVLEAQAAQGLITLPGAVTNRSAQEAKVVLLPLPVSGARGRLRQALREPEDREERLSAGLPQRMDQRRLREAQNALRRLPIPRVFACHRQCGAKSSPGVGSAGSAWPRPHHGCALLAKDDDLNQMIIEDVVAAVQAGRSPVLLTERREHLAWLAE